MEIYRDLNLHRTGQDAGEGVFRGANKEGIDKENEGVRTPRDARVALLSGTRDAGNVVPSTEGGSSDAEQELKGRRQPELSQHSQRTVLEDVTHRYNSSSSSESYSNSEDMAVDGAEVGEPEVVQPVTVAGSQRAVNPLRGSPPTRTRARKMKRVLDKSFTRRMR